MGQNDFSLTEMLKEASKKATEQKKRELTGQSEPENQPEAEDFNILPFPENQEIRNGENGAWIQWWWDIGEVRVWGILYTTDTKSNDGLRKKGQYEVQLSMPEKNDVYNFNSDESKAIGKAMLSASNWINIWKEHAGMFLEKNLMGDE